MKVPTGLLGQACRTPIASQYISTNLMYWPSRILSTYELSLTPSCLHVLIYQDLDISQLVAMAEPAVPYKDPLITSAAYTMPILATIAVALRSWSRHVSQSASFWWDDWFALIALVRQK